MAKILSSAVTVADRWYASAPAVYTTKLLSDRPAQHVAWRGDSIPNDPLVLVDLFCGQGYQ